MLLLEINCHYTSGLQEKYVFWIQPDWQLFIHFYTPIKPCSFKTWSSEFCSDVQMPEKEAVISNVAITYLWILNIKRKEGSVLNWQEIFKTYHWTVLTSKYARVFIQKMDKIRKHISWLTNVTNIQSSSVSHLDQSEAWKSGIGQSESLFTS